MARKRARLVYDPTAGIGGDKAALAGVLPDDYARPTLAKTPLGRLVDCVESGIPSCARVS